MKLKILFLCFLLILLFCACGQAEEIETARIVSVHGTDYVIDDAAGTISDGRYTYRYSWQAKNSGGYSLSFTYPDGSTWWWEQDSTSGYGGWSDSYDSRDSEFPDGFTLLNVLVTRLPKSGGERSVNPFLAIVLLAVGLLNTISPKTMWMLRYGWHYENAEPSQLALTCCRVIGILCLAAAAIIILIAVF